MNQIDLAQTDFAKACLDALPTVGYGPAMLIVCFAYEPHATTQIQVRHRPSSYAHPPTTKLIEYMHEFQVARQSRESDDAVEVDGVNIHAEWYSFAREAPCRLYWNQVNNLDIEMYGRLFSFGNWRYTNPRQYRFEMFEYFGHQGLRRKTKRTERREARANRRELKHRKKLQLGYVVL